MLAKTYLRRHGPRVLYRLYRLYRPGTLDAVYRPKGFDNSVAAHRPLTVLPEAQSFGFSRRSIYQIDTLAIVRRMHQILVFIMGRIA